jgi:Sulfotransferase family
MSAVLTDEGVLKGRADRILLIGIARSGTSWLSRAMAVTPGTLHYYEPDNVDADPTGQRPAARHGFGPYPIIGPGDDGGQFRALWDAAFAGRLPHMKPAGAQLKAMRMLLKLPSSVREPLISAGARVLTAMPGGPERTAIKSIYSTFYLEWLVKRYDPRVVAIQRNPLNVVSSWRELQIPGFDLTTRPALLELFRDRYEGPPPARDSSELSKIAWQVGLLTTAVGDALERHPEWLLVTHEYLCEDPSERMRYVLERAGMPWSPDVERFLEESNRPGQGLVPQRVTKDQPTRWRGRLSDEEVAEITSVLARFPRRGWIREPGEERAA